MQIEDRSDLDETTVVDMVADEAGRHAGGLCRRGADMLVDLLVRHGVDTVFSLSGNQIMSIYDACVGRGIEIVHVRHEAAAVFMADSYAQLTGRIGVALVTAAPGAANAVGPLYAAGRSESPVLLLSGDSAIAQDGMGAFQELDQVAMSRPLTKRSLRLPSAQAMPDMVCEMIALALEGRPGPVHLVLPVDVLEGPAASVTPKTSARPNAVAVDWGRIAAHVAGGVRPLVLCGPALSGSRNPGLPEQIERHLNAPVIVMESPRGLNDPAFGQVGEAIRAADRIVTLGKAIDFTLGFARTADAACAWMVVDADKDEVERARRHLGDRLVAGIVGDPRSIAAADAGARPVEQGDWPARVKALLSVDTLGEAPPQKGRITSRSLCVAVQRQIAACGKSVVICDGGEFGQWAQRMTKGTFRLVNGPSGAIGGSVCYAIAAGKAHPEATIFALMGDGTVGFHLAEFETAVRAGTPFVAIVGNDRRWNAEHLIQLREYGADRLIGCELSDARYDACVAALGGHGEYVVAMEDLDAALERAIRSGKPACVNVDIEGLPAPAGPAH